MKSPLKISVVVPVYNRPDDLRYLLSSVLRMDILPFEVVLNDDCSPEREKIREVIAGFRKPFADAGVRLNYIENTENKGYDGNLRSGISAAEGDWVMLMGNDDAILPQAGSVIQEFLSKFPDSLFVSRAFIRFTDSVDQPLGVSRLASVTSSLNGKNIDSGYIFRAGAFVGGLLLKREWAQARATDRYDGTLYYQIYLAASAFCEYGIGYISTPIVGGRTGNPPLFGGAKSEAAVHVPGSYTAKGRASMWRGVLTIVKDAQSKYGQPVYDDVHRELAGRQSFHIFEMTARYGRDKSIELARELGKLGLMRHPYPIVFFIINIIFGRYAAVFYNFARSRLQK